MVIVGKSGSGKSYATKSLLSNLASEDAKIFILDPENEYSELAHNLHGKVINVGNAKYGRLNPFHIITALDDDEAGVEGGGPGGSFATHLQFLEEFFRQILPDIDKDALEYLNSLIERVYLNFGITPETDLSTFTAEDYPIFDDLYDVVLAEFERTNNEYLRQLLRSLVNYIAKFSTGGRNANIWNGPSTITTDENFSVFNFQSMLANRNTTIANAQMLLVLKYIDNEIIKNRDYNTRYGLKRKVVVVIDEAHVFIDTKFPVALDFMFQLAKRIRKYNGMQIVITQNIKDFVGSEEIARKSSAIINACQYSFVFGLAPNDMDDLCKLYAKAGGINEQEQEDILGAKRGQAFTIMSPTSRSSFQIEVPSSMVDMFENMDFESNYFSGEDGKEIWEDFVAESRESHDANLLDRIQSENSVSETVEQTSSLTFSEISEEEAEQLMSEESVDTEASGRGQRKSAMEKLMEAEEVVDRREYEMAVGRFGGISFSETAGEEYDSEQASGGSEGFGGISFSETTGEEYDNEQLTSDDDSYGESYGESFGGISFGETTGEEYDNEQTADTDEIGDEGHEESFGETNLSEEKGEEYDSKPQIAAHHGNISNSRDASNDVDTRHGHNDNIQSAGVRTDAPAQDDYTYSKAYIEEELNRFKASVREEMERELEERLKWISLGAGIGATGLVGVADMGTGGTLGTADEGAVSAGMMTAGGEMPVAREAFKQASSEEGYKTEEGYSTEEYRIEEGYGLEEDYEAEFGLPSEESYGDEGEFNFDEDYETSEEYGSEEEYDSEEGYDEDSEYDEDESDVEFEDDESEDDEFELPEDEFFFDDEDSEYEPAPFVFADLLDSMAEEYADMNLDERMEELGEPVMEITLEELAAYVKEKRKK